MDNEEKNGFTGTEGAENRNDRYDRREGDDRGSYASREANGGDRPFRPRFNSDDRGGDRPFRPRFNNDDRGGDRPFRPRFNSDDRGGDRPFRPRFNNDDRGGDRPFRPRFNNDDRGGDRPFRPRFNNDDRGGDRPFRPRFNNDDRGGDRPFHPRFNNDDRGGDRPFRPRFNNDDRGGDRPFRPRFNNDDRGGDRPFRPRFNSDEQGGDRPFRPRFNSDDRGGDRPFRPRFNSEEQGGDRPFRPRFNSDDRGGDRPFRPRFNNDERGGRPRYNDDRGGRFNRGGLRQDGRPAQHQQWKLADPSKVGPRYKIDSRIFDNEQESDANGTDPEMQQMPALLRLNRFIAMSGVCSRREADELIKAGKISVDGQVVTEMGVTVSPDAKVVYNGKELKAEKKVYVLLNKPKDTVTTTDDPEGRRTVMDIVAGASNERIYPVGRLDRNTTGILLLTNDGDMAEKLMHPRYEVRKIYHVFLDKAVTEEDLETLVKGMELEDGPINADEVSYVDPRDRKQVGIVIHSGRNRIVRRMFEHLGYNVEKLDRVYYGGLTKLNVPRGHWRYLTDEEINRLKAGFTK